ncbi:sugar phosphate isomerase/epimerase family protein [Catalinimonas niigatensis]|uniref:sugar phosphate isomerase/epimerase family protein n=1 Tax=Catalinimonas niigatensis TaxID=1397264 RepID=UPI002666A4FB|nr:sugar phosphate isomerase/epimerase [Catalinimonas niigatensis]WPP49277.1 sugar phosphate isomerase/epimerase [Catalinimonas niigatensis]
MKYTRKSFLQLLGLGALATTSTVSFAAQSLKSNIHPVAASPLKLGIASYSLRSLSLDEVIAVSKRLQLNSVCLKSMHLPLDTSPKELKAMAKKVKDAGLDLYAAGVIYMKSADEVNQAFDYAKTAGLKMIVGVPNHDLLPLVEKKVKETDIKLAIHNHGPGDDVYPSPDSVYEKIKNLDKRIGLCIDIGHTFRIGQDPAEKAKQYAERLYDIHLKDVDGTGAEGETLELGRGVMDIPAFLSALQAINYTGVVGLEYEKDGDDPVPGLAESVGYARGVMSALNV